MKGRGTTRGHEITPKVAKDGKITVTFDKAGGTWKALGDYGPWFGSAIDIHTNDIYEPFHNTWKDFLASHKRDIQDRMLVSTKIFLINFSLSSTLKNH